MSTQKARARKVYDTSGNDTIAVAGEVTAYSASLATDGVDFFSVSYKASSGGTINVKIEVQLSSDNSNFVEPEYQQDVDAQLEDTDWHVIDLPIPRIPYLRFKVTGLTGNAATTKVEFILNN